MQRESVRGKRDEQAEALPEGYVSGGEGQDGYNVGVGEGFFWTTDPLELQNILHVYVIVTLVLKVTMGGRTHLSYTEEKWTC